MIDLHASHFDSVFRLRDYNQFMHPTLPDELVEEVMSLLFSPRKRP